MHLVRIPLLLALIATSLFFAAESLAFVKASGPYATVVLSAGVVLLVATLARALTYRAAQPAGDEIALLMRGRADRHVRLVLFTAIWLGYAALLPVLGFVLATTAALTGTILIGGARGALPVVLGCFAFAVGLTVLVKTALYVAVPEAAPERWLELLLFQLRN